MAEDSYKLNSYYLLYYAKTSGNRRKNPDNGNPGSR